MQINIHIAKKLLCIEKNNLFSVLSIYGFYILYYAMVFESRKVRKISLI